MEEELMFIMIELRPEVLRLEICDCPKCMVSLQPVCRFITAKGEICCAFCRPESGQRIAQMLEYLGMISWSNRESLCQDLEWSERLTHLHGAILPFPGIESGKEKIVLLEAHPELCDREVELRRQPTIGRSFVHNLA